MEFKEEKRYGVDGLRTIFICGKCNNPSFFIRETKTFRIFMCTKCFSERKERRI